MQINVELLEAGTSPNPTRAMGIPAAMCYRKTTIKDLVKGLPDKDCERIVKKVLATGHHSVLEHAIFQFGVEGVSRNFSHQMVRHRNTSYEQQSLHYIVADDGFEVASPPGLNHHERRWWKDAVDKSFAVYKALVGGGVPREDARHVLPSGIETKLVMTANLRQWMHFVKIRACDVNCQEILVVAMKVKKHLERLMPYMKEHLGPPCHNQGICPEGKKYCGHPWKLPCTVLGMPGKPPTITKKGKLCKTCKGHGYWEEAVDGDGGPPISETVPCEDCNQEGVQKDD